MSTDIVLHDIKVEVLKANGRARGRDAGLADSAEDGPVAGGKRLTALLPPGRRRARLDHDVTGAGGLHEFTAAAAH